MVEEDNCFRGAVLMALSIILVSVTELSLSGVLWYEYAFKIVPVFFIIYLFVVGLLYYMKGMSGGEVSD